METIHCRWLMETIEISKVNDATLHVKCQDTGVLMELSEFLTFVVEGARFTPAYKNGTWDGKIRLMNRRNQTLPFGLINKLAGFCKERGYKLKCNENVKPYLSSTDEELETFLKDLPLPEEIEAREYQLTAFKRMMKTERGIMVSPTGSGKSFMIYLMIRYFLSQEMDKKVVIIVPTTSLVEQMYGDFEMYSKADPDFDVAEECHRIYSGKEKFVDNSIVISTWQSCIKLPQSWFNPFGMVIGDEAHTFKAKSLTTIMDRLVNAPIRIGTTGTLDGAEVHEFVLEGCFGPTYTVTTAKKLMDAGTLSNLDVQCLVLKYSDQERKAFGKRTYQEEIDYIVTHEKRNNFITNLALDQEGNTLILFNLVKKHGKPLFQMLMDKNKDNRPLFYVSGEVGVEERERIRALTETSTGAIIVASMGCFSTGINIKELHNIIFAAPTKSQIRVLQSIGRGLRISKTGQGTFVFDVTDDFSWKSRKNYTLKHGRLRVGFYSQQKFNYSINPIDI